MTSTNGSAASPRAAARNGVRNSSPPSVGESTLLWRLTLGMPGIAPSRTSSIPGWPAAVIDTESPSQLIPSEIQRMSTSCTPGGLIGSVAIACSVPRRRQRRELLVELERLHQQLLAGDQLQDGAAAGGAQQREGVLGRLDPAVTAPAHRRHMLDRELRAL